MTGPASAAGDFDRARDAFLAGLACHQAGDHAAAERHYEASLALLPGRPSTLVNLAATRLRLGRPADALACVDAVLAADADHVDALLHRGTALAQLGRAAAALAAFERLTRIDPTHPVAWSHRGNLLRESGRLDDAVAAYREALRHGADAELHRFYLAGLGGDAAPSTPPRDYVEPLFDAYAGDFDEHLVGQLGYRAHERIVERVRRCAGERPPFDDALDLGCGTGLCGPLLRPLARQLTGVDLSAAMVERSRARGVYDRLVHDDAVRYLAAAGRRHDLVVAADVLIYLGDPVPLFAALQRAMPAGGLFAFTAEALDGEDDGEGVGSRDGSGGADDGRPAWRLLPSLRYAHDRHRLVRQAQAHGFEPLQVESAAVRREQGRDVAGLYLVLRRLPDGTAG